jgi:hypothetical protein
MSDDLRNPIGAPMTEEDGSETGEVTEKDYEEAEEMDENLTDDPTVADANDEDE